MLHVYMPHRAHGELEWKPLQQILCFRLAASCSQKNFYVAREQNNVCLLLETGVVQSGSTTFSCMNLFFYSVLTFALQKRIHSFNSSLPTQHRTASPYNQFFHWSYNQSLLYESFHARDTLSYAEMILFTKRYMHKLSMLGKH